MEHGSRIAICVSCAHVSSCNPLNIITLGSKISFLRITFCILNLNKLFGLWPSEIAEMEGMKGSSSVRQLIIRMSDQLKCGELSLIETTPEEAEEAKKRLDTQREKRRERYERKKD
jgi:hypothetical protein